MKNRAAIVAIALLALVWGYNWVVIKVATEGASPFAIVAIRTVLGSAALFIVAAFGRRPLKSPPWKWTALIGFFQIALMTTLQTLALATGGAGKTTVLVYTFPFWIVLLSIIFLDERLTRMRGIAVLCAAAGLAFVLYPLDVGHAIWSNVLALCSAFSWAIGSIITKRFRATNDVDLISFTAWQMAYGALPVVIIVLLLPHQYVHFTMPEIASLAYIVLLGTALAFWLWFFIMERLTATTAGISSLLAPVVAVIAAWIQLGEKPGTPELIGMLLIVSECTRHQQPPHSTRDDPNVSADLVRVAAAHFRPLALPRA